MVDWDTLFIPCLMVKKLIGNNFKLNPNAKLGYSDGKYYYTPDDWYDEVFSSNFRQEYNVNISGRSDKLNYYASVGYLNDSVLFKILLTNVIPVVQKLIIKLKNG